MKILGALIAGFGVFASGQSLVYLALGLYDLSSTDGMQRFVTNVAIGLIALVKPGCPTTR